MFEVFSVRYFGVRSKTTKCQLFDEICLVLGECLFIEAKNRSNLQKVAKCFQLIACQIFVFFIRIVYNEIQVQKSLQNIFEFPTSNNDT